MNVTTSEALQEYKDSQPKPDSINQHLAKFALLLKAEMVTRVIVEFSGSGDSGQIDEISFFGGDRKRMNVPDFPLGRGHRDAFNELWYAVLDARGWEVNNEGSQGSIEWDLENDEINMVLGINYMTTEDHRFNGLEVIDNVDSDAIEWPED